LSGTGVDILLPCWSRISPQVFHRFRKEVGLAGFAAEALTPMVVGDKSEFSATVRTAILQFSHDAPLRCTLAGNAAPGWRSGKHAALLLDFRRIKVLQYELGGEIATEIIERLESKTQREDAPAAAGLSRRRSFGFLLGQSRALQPRRISCLRR
jgi:hypothetical protein